MAGQQQQLFVKTLTGKTLTVCTRTGMTIGEMKEELARLEGVAPAEQRLIFCGKVLEDDKTVEDYNFAKSGTIHLVLRLGGSEVPTKSANKT
jgi:Ubiquitin family